MQHDMRRSKSGLIKAAYSITEGGEHCGCVDKCFKAIELASFNLPQMNDIEVDRFTGRNRFALQFSVNSDVFAGRNKSSRLGCRGRVLRQRRKKLSGAVVAVMFTAPRQLVRLPDN